MSIPQLQQRIGEVTLPKDSVSLPALIDSIASRQDVDSIVKTVKDSLEAHPGLTETLAKTIDEHLDEVPLDTIIPPGAEAAIKTKRDTTTMDSLELAISK